MGNNVEKSYRELMIAVRVDWARKRALHPRAIEYAGKYLNLDNQMLQLISDYENANSLPDDSAGARVVRKREMHEAWDNVIKYVRLLSRKEASEAA
jgi:hypothetical protein